MAHASSTIINIPAIIKFAFKEYESYEEKNSKGVMVKKCRAVCCHCSSRKVIVESEGTTTGFNK